MDSVLEFLLAHAKMLGVIAAIIIFGSWLVENTLLRRAKDLKESLQQAESDEVNTERFFRVETKLLEVYQVAASARKYSAEARQVSSSKTYKDELYSDVELLESVGVTLEFAEAITRMSARSEQYLAAISPPQRIGDQVRTSTRAMNDLRKELEVEGENYRSKQVALVGDPINLNTITKDQASKLTLLIRAHRDTVELSLASKLPATANSVFRSFDSLFAFARTELTVRERRAQIAEDIKIALFVIGSILALVGSYLDAAAPKK